MQTTRRAVRLLVHVLALALFSLSGARAAAQEPVRLPGVRVTAAPLPPGPALLTGVVRDTFQTTLDGVEISIAKLQRRAFTNDEGLFRFDRIPRGRYSVRARRVGFAPQVREIEVGDDGGIGEFELVHFATGLPAVVSSAVGGGLSGVVGDTAYVGVADAVVHVKEKGMHVRTDSLGAFFLPLSAGSYMVTITREGYREKVVSVRIPADSGRRMSAFLVPFAGTLPVREVWNVRDLETRLAWRSKLKDVFYTRAEMEKSGAQWAYELLRMGGQAQYDSDCSVIVNGGPATRPINELTVDELEAMEIYASVRGGGAPRVPTARERPGVPRVSKAKMPAFAPNTSRAAFENQFKFCPVAYVWLR